MIRKKNGVGAILRVAKVNRLVFLAPVLGVMLTFFLWLDGRMSLLTLAALATIASVTAILVGALPFYMLQKSMPLWDKRNGTSFLSLPNVSFPKLGPIILSAYLSATIVLGRMLDQTGQIEWALETAVKVIAGGLVALPVFAVLFYWLDSINANSLSKNNSDVEAAPRNHSNSEQNCDALALRSRPFLSPQIVWLFCILIPQIMLFLICYPGIYGYDGAFHIWQIIHSEGAPVHLNKGYSVLYTLYLSLFVGLGRHMGNVELGFAVAMFLQMLLLCWVSWKIVCFIQARRPQARALRYGSLLFLSLCPPILCLRISSCQDAPFAAFFCLAIMRLATIKTENKEKNGNRWIIALWLDLIMAFLLRNNASYAYIFLLITAVIMLVRHAITMRLAAILTIPFIVSQIIMGPLYSACGITENPANPAIREILSVPSQQLARVYTGRPDLLTEKQKTEIIAFYPNQDQFTDYWAEPELADRAKGSLDASYAASHLLDYIRLYISVGSADPENFIEAFFMNSLGYWYPGKTYPDTRMYHPYFEYNNVDALWWNADYTPIQRMSFFPELDQLISNAMYDGSWNKTPALSLLCRAGFYSAVFITVCVYSIHAKYKNNVLPLIFVGGLFVTLFLSPVCLFRYVFGISMATPLLIMLLVPLQNSNDSISG